LLFTHLYLADLQEVTGMPRGASPKREREYEKLKSQFEETGRYKGREKEVASRIVNKQRARFGETKAAKTKAKGRSGGPKKAA